MKGNSSAPGISIKPVIELLDKIGVSGYGEFNEETGLVSQWPLKEQWQNAREFRGLDLVSKTSLVSQLSQLMDELEQEFNNYLGHLAKPSAQSSTIQAKLGQTAAYITGMFTRVESIITVDGLNAPGERLSNDQAYFYLNRTIALNFTLKKTRELQGDQFAQNDLSIFVNKIINYLDFQRHQAVAERIQKLSWERTGVENDRCYLIDKVVALRITGEISAESCKAILPIENYIHARLAIEAGLDCTTNRVYRSLLHIMQGQASSVLKELNVNGDALSVAWTNVVTGYQQTATAAWQEILPHKHLLIEYYQVDPNLLLDRMSGELVPLADDSPTWEDALKFGVEVGRLIDGIMASCGAKGGGIFGAVSGFLEYCYSLINPEPTLDEIRTEIEKMISEALADNDRRNITNQLMGYARNVSNLLQKIESTAKEKGYQNPMSGPQWKSVASIYSGEADLCFRDLLTMREIIFRKAHTPRMKIATLGLVGQYTWAVCHSAGILHATSPNHPRLSQLDQFFEAYKQYLNDAIMGLHQKIRENIVHGTNCCTGWTYEHLHQRGQERKPYDNNPPHEGLVATYNQYYLAGRMVMRRWSFTAYTDAVLLDKLITPLVERNLMTAPNLVESVKNAYQQFRRSTADDPQHARGLVMHFISQNRLRQETPNWCSAVTDDVNIEAWSARRWEKMSQHDPDKPWRPDVSKVEGFEDLKDKI